MMCQFALYKYEVSQSLRTSACNENVWIWIKIFLTDLYLAWSNGWSSLDTFDFAFRKIFLTIFKYFFLNIYVRINYLKLTL